jgi:hypothetical protein
MKKKQNLVARIGMIPSILLEEVSKYHHRESTNTDNDRLRMD